MSRLSDHEIQAIYARFRKRALGQNKKAELMHQVNQDILNAQTWEAAARMVFMTLREAARAAKAFG